MPIWLEGFRLKDNSNNEIVIAPLFCMHVARLLDKIGERGRVARVIENSEVKGEIGSNK